MNLIENLKTNLVNIPGWRTSRKIIVIESDDWGSVRMASKEAYNRMLNKGYPVENDAYNRFDALESNDDVLRLAEILQQVKDSSGNPAKFTLNNIVANPDFEKIKTADFQQYHFEPFTETLKKYPDSSKVMEYYFNGLESGVFQVQFHGREHVHINNWLRSLREKDKLFLDAFDNEMFTCSRGGQSNCNLERLDAMAAFDQKDFETVVESIRSGTKLFQSTWGFSSKSIIAPCYTWNSEIEKIFHENGYDYIQGGRVQKQPVFNSQSNTIKRKFTGQKNRYQQRFMIRNVMFEPATDHNKDWISEALKEIEVAFLWRKPAVISSHRLNYIGRLCRSNQEKNLESLKDLLNEIISRWPEVEFLSSDQLGDLIKYRK